MSRGSPANFLREQRPRLPSVRTASHFRGGRERAATFSGFPLPPSLFLVRVSYLNRRPFYGLRTRPPLPSFSPSFALTCLAAWADCSSLSEYILGWHPLPLESAIRGLAAFETTRACVPPCEVVRHNMQSVRHLPRKCHVASIQFPASHLLCELPLMMSAEWFE